MFQRRWYIVTAWGLMLGAIGASFGFILIKSMSSRWLQRHEDLVNAIGASILLALGLAAILWTCWAIPYFAAPHLARRQNSIPMQRLGSMRVGTIIPGCICLMFGTMLLYQSVIEVRVFQWDVSVTIAVSLCAVGIILALFGWFIGRKAIARLLQACRDEKVCFKCAYDLRGSESMKCPECGHGNHQ